MRRSFFAAALMMAAIAGCSRVEPNPGMREVRALVAERMPEAVGLAGPAAAERVKGLLAGDLTAASAIEIALINNRALRATLEELKISDAEVLQAGLLKNPVLDAAIKIPFSGGGTGVELTVVQDFLDGVWIPLRKEVAAAEFEATKLRVSAAVIEVATRTKIGVVEVQTAGEMVKLRKMEEKAAEVASAFAYRMREAGNITELEAASEKVETVRAQMETSAAEEELALARGRLAAVMGLEEGEELKVAMTMGEIRGELQTAGELEEKVVARNLGLAAARMELEADDGRIKLAKPMGFLPDLKVGATAEKDYGNGWALGPAVSVELPVFDQGEAKAAGLEARHRQAHARYAAMEIAVRAETRAVRVRVMAARQRALEFQGSVIPLREKIVEQTQLEVNGMLKGVFALLAAKKSEIEARVEYVGALCAYWVGEMELEGLMAGKGVDDGR